MKAFDLLVEFAKSRGILKMNKGDKNGAKI